MNILIINGDTKKTGFIPGALRIVRDYLKGRGINVNTIHLSESKIKDCVGCLECLKNQTCPIDDDMKDIIDQMLLADGFVTGSPIRNGSVTACYKRFFERVTYILGFPLHLEDKYTLAITSVGLGGGKAVNRNYLGFQEVFHTILSDYLFYRVGFPVKIKAQDVRMELIDACKKLIDDIEHRKPKKRLNRLKCWLDRLIVKQLMLKKSPELFSGILEHWKDKGYH